eukprot:jgi/Bigna1/127085/aug1.3_g1793
MRGQKKSGKKKGKRFKASGSGLKRKVASQFDCLEFVNPSVTPEDGVASYAHDVTQGPACAIAAGPATAYRNHFVKALATKGRWGRRGGKSEMGKSTTSQRLRMSSRTRKNATGRVFLTFVGDGAFGNPKSWVGASMRRAFKVCSSRLLLSSQESDEGTGDDSDEDPDDDKEDDEDNEDDDNDDDGDGDSVLSGGKECGSSIQAAQEERGGEEETPAPGKTNRERDEEDGDDNDDNDDDDDEDGDDNGDNDDDDDDDDEDGQHKPEMKMREKAVGNPEKIATSASGSSRSAKMCW